MGPVRRSQRNARASSSKTRLEIEGESCELDDGVDQTYGETLQSLLARASGGAKELENENTALRKKVKALELRLDRAEDDAPLQPRRSKRTVSAAAAELHSEVAILKKQVRRLEKSNEMYRKKFHQLSIKEVENEAEDLLETADFEVGDSAHKMRKLLRRFHDLMLENSLDENEECLICFETLQPKKSRSLSCQHTFCNECVRRLRPQPVEPESIRCPQCREICARDEAELVELTASQQWDALLEVAQQWARMDVRREESTSEEEDAEQFIDDDPEEFSSTTASDPPVVNPLESSPEPNAEGEQPPIPQTPSRLRRRRAVTTPTPEPEEVHSKTEPAEAGALPAVASIAATLAEAVQEPQDDAPPLVEPTAPTSSTQRTPSYAQTLSKDKRKLLEQLAEARSKKPRLKLRVYGGGISIRFACNCKQELGQHSHAL